MKVNKRTPKTILAQRVIGTKVLGVVNPLAERLGFPASDINSELTLFVVLSTRVVFDETEIDFAPIAVADTEDQIAEKFIRYLDSRRYDDTIAKAWEALAEIDKPSDDALAPDKPKGDDNDPKSRR